MSAALTIHGVEFTDAKFFPGELVITPAADDEVDRERVFTCLRRHISGDWGVVPPEDAEQNDAGVTGPYRSRLLSAYPIDESKPTTDGENTFWIITEEDRSVTTVLLPDDY